MLNASRNCATQNKESKKYFFAGDAGVWYFAAFPDGFSPMATVWPLRATDGRGLEVGRGGRKTSRFVQARWRLSYMERRLTEGQERGR